MLAYQRIERTRTEKRTQPGYIFFLLLIITSSKDIITWIHEKKNSCTIFVITNGINCYESDVD